MYKFRSVATWPEDHNPLTSHDNHDTYREATFVCRMLDKEGYGGECRVFPVRTCVEKVRWEDNRVINLTYITGEPV